MREGCLAQPWRTTQEDMLDRLVPAACRLEQDAEILAHLLLAHVLGKQTWAQRPVELFIVRPSVENYVAHFLPNALSATASASCVDGVDFQSTDSMPVRASCDEKPRFRSADSTAFGTTPSPAIAAARGTTSSSAMASSRGLSSMITFAAVRGPTPLARLIGDASSATIARFRTSRLAELSMLSPTLGPTPSTWISISNMSSSSTVTKPYSASWSSRTCVWMWRSIAPPGGGSCWRVPVATLTMYPTPPTSTTTKSGPARRTTPLKCAITKLPC